MSERSVDRVKLFGKAGKNHPIVVVVVVVVVVAVAVAAAAVVVVVINLSSFASLHGLSSGYKWGRWPQTSTFEDNRQMGGEKFRC